MAVEQSGGDVGMNVFFVYFHCNGDSEKSELTQGAELIRPALARESACTFSRFGRVVSF